MPKPIDRVAARVLRKGVHFRANAGRGKIYAAPSRVLEAENKKPKIKKQSEGTNNFRDRFVIIMAGGKGERFWPLSREKMPKQLLTLLGKKSFLQEAVERVLPLVPAKNVFVITNEAQLPEVCKQLPKIPKNNLVAESIGRDTCAAVTLGAALARPHRRT